MALRLLRANDDQTQYNNNFDISFYSIFCIYKPPESTESETIWAQILSISFVLKIYQGMAVG